MPVAAHSLAGLPSPRSETPPTIPSLTPEAGDLPFVEEAVATPRRAMLTVAPVAGAVGSPAGAEEVLDAFEEVTIFVLDELKVEEGAAVTTALDVDEVRTDEEDDEVLWVDETLEEVEEEEGFTEELDDGRMDELVEGRTEDDGRADDEGRTEEDEDVEDALDEAEVELLGSAEEVETLDEELAPVETGPEEVEFADADTVDVAAELPTLLLC